MILTDKDILHTVSEDAKPEELEGIFAALETEIKLHGNALGLSAPQVGIFKRCFVYYGQCEDSSCDCHKKNSPHLLRVTNPTITSFYEPMIMSREGCLSIPGKTYSVERYKQIVATTNEGSYTLWDEDAIVFQHEYDHLNGILISDKGLDVTIDVGRNQPCPCGKKKNGKPVKYKLCHGK